jgi:hypothetical protein
MMCGMAKEALRGRPSGKVSGRVLEDPTEKDELLGRCDNEGREGSESSRRVKLLKDESNGDREGDSDGDEGCDGGAELYSEPVSKTTGSPEADEIGDPKSDRWSGTSRRGKNILPARGSFKPGMLTGDIWPDDKKSVPWSASNDDDGKEYNP